MKPMVKKHEQRLDKDRRHAWRELARCLTVPELKDLVNIVTNELTKRRKEKRDAARSG